MYSTVSPFLHLHTGNTPHRTFKCTLQDCLIDPKNQVPPMIESSSLHCRYLQNTQISTGFLVNKEENMTCLPVAPLNVPSIDILDNGGCRHSSSSAKNFYEICATTILARIARAWCSATLGFSDCVGICNISTIWDRKRGDQKIREL